MLKSGQAVRMLTVLVIAILLITAVSGCTSNSPQPGDTGKIYAAVSIVPQAGFVKAVGGDLVEVLTMIPPGANPEDYAPHPQIMEQLSHAQIYFAIGVATETNGILPRLRQINPQMKVVDLPQQVDQVYPAREIAPGEKDPHRWMSPKRAIIMVQSIARELAGIDPQNAAVYQKNALQYQSELEELDAEITRALTGRSGRSFIVYHPAMGYFADDYGLKMIALEQEGKSATAGNIQSVIDQARRENIKVVFYQAEMDGRQAQTLARELGGEAELIVPLAEDYIDNLRRTGQLFARVLGT